MKRQTPPLSIQVELTEGCNLGCSFCGLRGMRKNGTKPWKFMDRNTATLIATGIANEGWNSRIIFSMHGEPTLNPNAVRIIKLFRKALPNAVMSIMTNGYRIMHNADGEEHDDITVLENIKTFADAGLNDLIFDSYSNNGDAAKIEAVLDRNEHGYKIDHLDKGVPLYTQNSKKFRILFNPPIQLEGAINRHLCNHCGAAGPLDFSYAGKRCARPFRELTFRYDGAVALCCNDFRGEYPIGNIHEMMIDDIWQHKRFQAARILLYAGERTFKPCYGCNALSHRVGLLPDRMGKETMPEPTEKIRDFAKSITKNGGHLCEKVYKRKWEE